MKSLKTTEQALKSAGWMLLDAAENLFVTAKARVVGTNPDSTGSFIWIQKDRVIIFIAIEPLLEENPKWTALKEIMKEIQSEIDSRPEGELPSYKTLIVTDDDRTCLQLRQILQTSSRQFLLSLYQKTQASHQGSDKHKWVWNRIQ